MKLHQPTFLPPNRIDTHEPRQTALMGILICRESWFLSLRGVLLFLTLVLLFATFAIRNLYTYLSASNSVPSDVLVIDAWMPTYDLELAARYFKAGHFDVAIAVTGVYQSETSELEVSRPEYAARILRRFGVPREKLKLVLFPALDRDRTFFSALAVKEWCGRNLHSLRNIDLVTVGAHARRSRLLYEMAFGHTTDIGVIAMEDPAYDPNCWWRSSEGISEVLFESAAYLYVKLLFYPVAPTTIHSREVPLGP